MVVWIRTRTQAVRLEDSLSAAIYVGGSKFDLGSLVQKLTLSDFRIEKKFERLDDYAKRNVLRIPVENQEHAKHLARRISALGAYEKYRLYNVDVPFNQMYLYQHDIFPLAKVEVDQNSEKIGWQLMDSDESLDYELPSLRIVRLEVKPAKTCRIARFTDPIDTIILGDETEKIVFNAGSEREKLVELVNAVRRLDPDILVTSNGDDFVLPYLVKRAAVNGVLSEISLGREPAEFSPNVKRGRSYFSYGKIYYRPVACRIPGRIHIDEQNASIYSDCKLHGLFEVARVCRIPIQRASRTTIGTCMKSIQIYHAVKNDILIPWNKNEPEDFKDGKELIVADRGGFVFEPRMGLFDQVGEVDFASLYPTLMLKKNLSAETVNCHCCVDSPNRVPELDYHLCTQREGIVPKSLRLLLTKRAAYKQLKRSVCDPYLREIYDQRQAALKWILVCSFGFLGFKNARFGKIDAHIATCAFARDVLKKATRIAENHGFEVVHGIVDSLWLRKQDASCSDFENLCAQIENYLNLPVGFEGRYKWILFLSSKVDPRLPVLNRYYGMFEDGIIKIRGIELRCHDTCDLVRRCQSEMLQVFARANDAQEFRALIPDALTVLKHYVKMTLEGKAPISDLIIEKQLSKQSFEYTKNTLQVIAARQLVSDGVELNPGQLIRYVITDSRSKILANRVLAADLLGEHTVYDSRKYAELLILSACNLLQPLGYTRERLTKLMMS